VRSVVFMWMGEGSEGERSAPPDFRPPVLGRSIVTIAGFVLPKEHRRRVPGTTFLDC
jgi:hypothetical protein